ncbi:MAG TPA: response regulator [Candidatus Angelobacter sp.]|jgi:CheY-like chemotaxis protein|nr:response regulator [Candidatus Angelobacter sp.]
MSEWTRKQRQSQSQFTILYVDDEPLVLSAWAELIETAGYRVLTANGGRDAMRLFLAVQVHLVILDYAMPGMTGAAIAAQIKQIDGDVPLILHSGGSSTITQEELLLFNCFIPKSNTLSVLLKAIQEALPASLD